MNRTAWHRFALMAVIFFGVWLVFRYLLPVFLPFGLGLLLALTAEPAVHFSVQRLKLPRWAASGAGVTLTLLLLLAIVGAVGAVTVKELGSLAGYLPDLQQTARETTDRLRFFLEDAAARAPEGVRPLMDRSVERLFSSGTELMEQVTIRLPGAVSGFLGRVPDGVLGIGTGILSGFMFSARLPKLKETVAQKLPESFQTRLLPAVKQSKKALFGWLKAQFKLAAVTYGILTVGFLLLRVRFAPLWAAAVALVDAVPLLGTGTVLLPWALVCLGQGQHLRAIGLIAIYGAAFLTRTVLEPRFVGRHLGIDPLMTLVFLYLGYRFWGIPGMLVAPMVLAAVMAAGRQTDLPENASKDV